MNAQIIVPLLTELGKKIDLNISKFDAQDVYYQHGEYPPNELPIFAEVLAERAARVRMNLVINAVPEAEFRILLRKMEFPILVFEAEGEEVKPVIITPCPKKDYKAEYIGYNGNMPAPDVLTLLSKLYKYHDSSEPENLGMLMVISAFPLDGLMDGDDADRNHKAISPLGRLLRLLRPEGKDIFYIYAYAILIGLINLSLPLGTQAIISLISGGLVFNSVVILIALVIIGILVGGGLQIMQLTLVEILQRRIFAKSAYEFAYRIPRWCYDHLKGYYPPELVNRFFDTITIQKGLPKMLIEVTAAALSIFFGLILLSLYHPFFVFFGLGLLSLLITVFYFSGTRGIQTSIVESKYKYKLANWLQEMARAIIPFKMAGDSTLSMKKTDELVNNYLKYRKEHFGVLVSQYGYIVAFKTIITGGLLIIGTLLVVDRQITLGQFVASEIVIVTIVSSVEKIIMSLDTVYDTLTGVDKIGHVMDLPLERRSGYLLLDKNPAGMEMEVKDLHFSYPESEKPALAGISFQLEPGHSLCISGHSNSGKNTLVKLMLGFFNGYRGIITYNGLSIRDISLPSLRSLIGENVMNKQIYDSTILYNITMGQSEANAGRVATVIHDLKLADTLFNNPEGLNAPILTGNFRLSESAKYKLTLARALVAQPKLVVIDDTILTLEKSEKLQILGYLMDKAHGWSLICISNDPHIAALCDRQIYLEEGKIINQPLS